MEELLKAPTMGHPSGELIFFLFMHGRKGDAEGVLTQKHGGHHRPIGYYSQQLDSVAKGSLPACYSHDMQTDRSVVGFSLTI